MGPQRWVPWIYPAKSLFQPKLAASCPLYWSEGAGLVFPKRPALQLGQGHANSLVVEDVSKGRCGERPALLCAQHHVYTSRVVVAHPHSHLPGCIVKMGLQAFAYSTLWSSPLRNHLLREDFQDTQTDSSPSSVFLQHCLHPCLIRVAW